MVTTVSRNSSGVDLVEAERERCKEEDEHGQVGLFVLANSAAFS
jgi:hypothetical protein